jgi:hypothetical protein
MNVHFSQQKRLALRASYKIKVTQRKHTLQTIESSKANKCEGLLFILGIACLYVSNGMARGWLAKI